MARPKYFAIVIAAVFTLLATGCLVSVEPESAVNPVGTTHTVTATFDQPDGDLDEIEFLCDLFEDLLDEQIPCEIETLETVQGAIEEPTDFVRFEVIAGPNTGTRSNGDCVPSCNSGESVSSTISWTYRSNGVPGQDVIEVCSDASVEELEYLIFLLFDIYGEEFEGEGITEEEFAEALLALINEEFDQDYVSFEDMFCETVTKTWVEERRPNIGAGLSGLFAGQPTPLPTAPAPAAATAPSQGIRPPSTGDAGLAD
jgi:hypothetical protein